MATPRPAPAAVPTQMCRAPPRGALGIWRCRPRAGSALPRDGQAYLHTCCTVTQRHPEVEQVRPY